MDLQQRISRNIEDVKRRINDACNKYNQISEEVVLMAVTKTNPPEYASAALNAGISVLGENRVQEAAGKRPEVKERGIWELIGPLQSNKVRLALGCVDRIQTIDRLKLVNRLSKTCTEMGLKDFPVLLQVNVDEDPAKHGCMPGEAAAMTEAIQQSGNLRLDGLMTIGEFSNEEEVVRPTFVHLRELRDRLSVESGLPLKVLSMGMTADLEWAIAEGSTLVRVGTAIFGERA